MMRRILLVLTVLLMPALASAANMQVTSSASPVSGGSISPNGIRFFAGPGAANYTITANPGWSVSSVKIDNIDTGAPYGTNYSIPYASGSVHTIKVTCTQATYSITASAGAGGQIQITGGGYTGIPAGSSRTIIVSPSTGYNIHSYIVDNGVPVVPADPTVAVSIPFNNILANHSISATFDFTPTVTSYAGADQTITADSSGAASTTLTGAATSNGGAITYQWNVTSKPAGAVAIFGSPISAITTLNVTALGTYTVNLAATSGGTTVVSSPVMITVMSAVRSAAIICTTCHTNDLQTAQWQSSPHGTSLKTTAPACPNCHNPGVLLPHPGYAIHDTTANPGLFYSCITCHFPGSTKVASWPPPGKSFHNSFNSTNKCVQCHDPHTTVFNVKGLPYPHFSTFSTAQYVTTNISCDRCHTSTVDSSFNVYSANRQWAKSGKGNPKSPAYIGAGPYTEVNLEAYDFKFLGTPLPAKPATTTSQDCVRCHTTTGFINYVTPSDPQNLNTAFSDIHVWGTPGDRTREMIACAACHNNTSGFDATFSRRSVGIETDPFVYPGVYNVLAWYGYSSASTKKIIRTKSYANPAGLNMNDSNLCIACHTGKASGDLIKLSSNCTTAPSIACRLGATGSLWATVDFIDPHNMNTANLMFPDGLRAGYEYRTGVSSSPAHTGISLETTQGPCVGCHMTSPQKHSFAVVSTASNGTIAAITTNVCTTCHGVTAMPIDAATLQAKKNGYQASLAVIAAQLAGKGIYYNAAKAPYFFTTAIPAQQTFATRTVNWNFDTNFFRGANLMGAAFNLRLLQPGAGWVHNSTYSKRILYDTIDYLDDGVQNGSATTTIQNISLDAYNYLVPRL